jgi:hypothetical protein
VYLSAAHNTRRKNMDDTTINTHPFEQAGLGKAPFRVLGMFEKVFSPAPGAPSKPGGTCDYCSNGILFCFTIRSVDGKEFVVGSDCVRKTTREGKLLTEVKKLKTDHDKKVRKTKADEQRRATIARLDAVLADPAITEQLQALPHPRFADSTFLSYATWMRQNAGQAGILEVLRLVSKTLTSPEAKQEYVTLCNETVAETYERLCESRMIRSFDLDRP